jgi:hypothetical protein
LKWLEHTIAVYCDPHQNYIISLHDVTKAEMHLDDMVVLFAQTNNSHDSHIGVKLEAFIAFLGRGGAGGYDFVNFISFCSIFYDLSASQAVACRMIKSCPCD